MSARKNTQFRRNYLVKCPCPSCSKDSEHSYNRVQKGLSWFAHTAALCSNLLSASKKINTKIRSDAFGGCLTSYAL
jgi:hypothetical protein